MKKSLILTIPEPCSQKWEEMTASDGGKHCFSCETMVIDFSRKTDAEIARLFLSNPDKKYCGRFLKTQLNRELVTSVTPQYSSSLAALVALALSMTVNPAFSQNAAQESTAVKISKDPIVPQVTPTTNKITGKVFDEVTGEPLPFVHVRLSYQGKTMTNAQSDFDGKFDLIVQEDTKFDFIHFEAMDYDTLLMSYVSRSSTNPDLSNVRMHSNIDKEILYSVGGPMVSYSYSKRAMRKLKRLQRREERRKN